MKRYWGMVLRRRYLVISVAFAVMFVFTLGGYIWPETYEASSTVFIQRGTIMDPLIQGVGTSVSMEGRLKSLKNSLTSRNIIDRVIKKLDLETEARSPQAYEGLIDRYQKKIDVDVKIAKGSRAAADMFVISYQGSNPKSVRDVVNTLVDEYIAENVGFRRTDAYNAYKFIKSQMGEYKAKLDETDAAIKALQGKGGATRQFVGEGASVGPAQTRLEILNTQLISLLSKYTDSHPEVIKTKAEIAELEKQPGDGKAGRSRTAQSHAPRSRQQGTSGESPEMIQLQHNRDIQQKIYDDLTVKLENARVSKDLELTDKVATFKVIDRAMMPYVPLKPNRVLLIIAGIFLGIAAGIGAVLGLDYLTHSFGDEDVMEQKLKIPVLVSIPSVVLVKDVVAAKIMDKKVLFASAAYLSVIIVVLALEILNRYFGVSLISF